MGSISKYAKKKAAKPRRIFLAVARRYPCEATVFPKVGYSFDEGRAATEVRQGDGRLYGILDCSDGLFFRMYRRHSDCWAVGNGRMGVK